MCVPDKRDFKPAIQTLAMHSSSIEAIRELLIGSVKRTGKFVLERQAMPKRMQEKTAKDFVTEVDEQAERMLIDAIRKEIPDASFFAEESGESGTGKYTFVIDPIDGTTNYIHDLPLFDIAVAVLEEGKPLLAVVHFPALGDLFVAENGQGAHLNGKRIRVADVGSLGEAMVLFTRSQYPPPIVAESHRILGELIRESLTLRIFGTGCLDYCYVARGSFAATITPLAEPFHMAGYLIMEEAGAKVTDFDGAPYSLDSETILAANPVLHEKLLDLVRRSPPAKKTI